MNNVFLIGEVVNNIEITSSNGTVFTNNFIIKNDSEEFEIFCKNELANDVYKNTSKGDIVAIQGYLKKNKQDTSKIIIVATTIKEFRNEKTDARITNEYNNSEENNNELLKKINKSTMFEVLNQIGKIVEIINNTQDSQSKHVEEEKNNTIKCENIEQKIQPNVDLNINEFNTENELNKHQRKDGERLV